MKIEDEFRVDVPVDEAWKVLLDVERIAPCMPGAQLQEVEGDEYRGIVKIKVGPITAQYKGVAKITEADETTHTGRPAGRGSRHARSGHRVGHRHRHAHARRRGHRGAHRHRPQRHRQGGAVRPRRDGRRVEQAPRPVRAEPRARRPEWRCRPLGTRPTTRARPSRRRSRARRPRPRPRGGVDRARARSTRRRRSPSTCSTARAVRWRSGLPRSSSRWSRSSPSACSASAGSVARPPRAADRLHPSGPSTARAVAARSIEPVFDQDPAPEHRVARPMSSWASTPVCRAVATARSRATAAPSVPWPTA